MVCDTRLFDVVVRGLFWIWFAIGPLVAHADWIAQPGKLRQVAAGTANELWGLDPSSAVVRWDGKGWQKLPGNFAQLDLGADGVAWAVDTRGAVSYWNGKAWAQVAGSLRSVSVGNADHVWGVDAAGGAWRFDRAARGFVRVEAPPRAQVAVGADGAAWAIDAKSQGLRFDGRRWLSVGGGMQQIAVANERDVWGIATDGTARRWDGRTWQPEPPVRLVQISVGQGGAIFGIDRDGGLHRFTPRAPVTPQPTAGVAVVTFEAPSSLDIGWRWAPFVVLDNPGALDLKEVILRVGTDEHVLGLQATDPSATRYQFRLVASSPSAPVLATRPGQISLSLTHVTVGPARTRTPISVPGRSLTVQAPAPTACSGAQCPCSLLPNGPLQIPFDAHTDAVSPDLQTLYQFHGSTVEPKFVTRWSLQSGCETHRLPTDALKHGPQQPAAMLVHPTTGSLIVAIVGGAPFEVLRMTPPEGWVAIPYPNELTWILDLDPATLAIRHAKYVSGFIDGNDAGRLTPSNVALTEDRTGLVIFSSSSSNVNDAAIKGAIARVPLAGTNQGFARFVHRSIVQSVADPVPRSWTFNAMDMGSVLLPGDDALVSTNLAPNGGLVRVQPGSTMTSFHPRPEGGVRFLGIAGDRLYYFAGFSISSLNVNALHEPPVFHRNFSGVSTAEVSSRAVDANAGKLFFGARGSQAGTFIHDLATQQPTHVPAPNGGTIDILHLDPNTRTLLIRERLTGPPPGQTGGSHVWQGTWYHRTTY